MRKRKILLISIGLSLLVWGIWSWPLPRHVGRGIPMTHSGGRGRTVLFMEPGDHLQLLYHFWIFSDMVAGNTPWMYNLYEFHTGDDSARYEPGAYYAPFSWIYSLGAFVGGRAFGYNLAGLVSIWLTYLFTWLLVRRYVSSAILAAAVSLIAVMLPYRWITLLGGSPTGFAMATPPLLFWGLDRAVRDNSAAGGFWAALAIIFSCCSDAHVFFFNILFTPFWCLVALIVRQRSFREYRGLAAALLPVAAGIALTALYSFAMRSRLAETVMAEGRTLAEVGLFTPRPSGFLGWRDHHLSGQIYLGYALLALLAAGTAALAIRVWRERPRPGRETLLFLVLLGGAALIAMLAIGPFGPHGGFFWRRARQWIPHYNMIRQSGKIYGILPPILALLAALSCVSLGRIIRSRRVALIAGGAALLLAGYEYGRRIDPIICRLAEEQPAYEAVAADASARGLRPHILAVVLWPGDTHYSSLYQHYSSLYRIRMINGYSPAVEASYFDEIFMRYMSVNQGWFTGEQADSLLGRGVTHLIVHEDHFPEKVSPFPVGATIAALLENPRLRLLKQDGTVWAFRLLAEPADPSPPSLEIEVLFSARHWVFENLPRRMAAVREDGTASRGRYLELPTAGGVVQTPGTHSPPAEDLRWMIRARGRGRLAAEVIIDEPPGPAETVAVESTEWAWLDVPAGIEEFSPISLKLTLESGTVDLCSALLTAGRPLAPDPGETVNLPAAWFFHRGYLDPETRRVHLRGGLDPPGAVFYGPKLPLEAGSYEIGLRFESPAPSGVRLGTLLLEQLFAPAGSFETPVIAGEPAALDFTVSEELPLNAVFVFKGNADVAIEAITIRRR